MVDWESLDYANSGPQSAAQPPYRRLTTLIRGLIQEGALTTGDALPPERTFARLAGLSRGTVSRAYDELARAGILTAVPGRGSLVASDRNVSTSSRKEQALRILGTALEQLETLGFTPWEIEAFTHVLLQDRELRVRALLVDCNPESLELVRAQLGGISHLELEPLLLEAFLRLEEGAVAGFDLVLTTETHAPQVLGHLARLRLPSERLRTVAVSPSPETLVALARLPERTPLAIRAHSQRFAELMERHLHALGQQDVMVQVGSGATLPSNRRLVRPASSISSPQETPDALCFDYQVDRGSLLRVEEAVTALLLQKSQSVLSIR